jgi:hypothetical protein
MQASPRPRLLLLAALFVLATVCVLGFTHAEPFPATDSPGPSSGPLYVGTGSCSARACHGGIEPLNKPIQQNEYTTWISEDKHARSYQILFDELSLRIAKNLHSTVPPSEDARCLACHATPLLADKTKGGLTEDELRLRRVDGVSCEACHGAARDWLAEHTEKDWKDRPVKDKEAKRMVDVGDLVKRTQLCTGCHVGAPAGEGIPVRDVNHDLIAAGHPRLNFEATAYLANMPAHWQAAAKKASRPATYEAQAWALGQALASAGAMDLLAMRAADKTRPWPEFAEYDCFACHHDLQAESWRQKRGFDKRTPGALPWDSWYTPLLDTLTQQGEPKDNPVQVLAELRKEMQKPVPPRGPVEKQARDMAGRLHEWVGSHAKQDWSQDQVKKLLLTIAKDEQGLAAANWDGAAQVYLALAALTQAYKDKEEPLILGLSKDLEFPPTASGVRFSSPADFGEKGNAFRKKLAELAGQVAK